MVEIVCIAIAVISVVVCVLLLMRSRTDGNKAEIEQLKQYISGLDDRNRQTLLALQENHRREVDDMRRQWERRVEEVEHESQLRFRNISNEVTKLGLQDLKATNSEQMTQVLTPLRERIESLTALVQRVEVDSTASQRSLTERIEQLASMNDVISREAKNLTEALRGNSKVQGDWGEMILESLLQKAGLQENVNYRVQVTRDEAGNVLRGENGELQRPDVVIDMPGDRHIVVDSKVSLKDYVLYCETSDADKRNIYGKQHVNSVKKHVVELEKKCYQKTVKNAVEHVLMFIPNEGAYLTAITLDNDIWQYAWQRGVVIVSPAHLLSTVQLIGQLWREERQDRNAAEIARVAGLLHDSAMDFVKRLDKVGQSLSSTVKAYDEAKSMLNETQPRSLLKRAARLKELGAKTK